MKHVTIQSRTQIMPVRRLGAGHDSGETEYRISNFGYPVSCAHAHAQTVGNADIFFGITFFGSLVTAPVMMHIGSLYSRK